MPIATPNESSPIKIGPSPGVANQWVRSMATKITKLIENAPANTVQNLFRSPPNSELQNMPVNADKITIHLNGILGSAKKLLN